ncbi:hypothetical protein GMI70_07795 [Eggerthellaceae bacterium zg-893]|nr:hypothetical protein [Eggerthellaceae bacterium zg-893]
MTGPDGQSLTVDDNAINKPGNVVVKVALKAADAKNYALQGADQDGNWTRTVPISAASEGTYTVAWGSNASTVAGVTAATDSAAGEVAYKNSKLNSDALDNLKSAMEVKFEPATAGATETTLDGTTYEATWYKGTTKLVNEDGEEVAPTNPGVYTAKINMVGSDEVVGELKLTVCADLATQVNANETQAESASAKPITVTVNGRYPDSVLLKHADGITKDALIAQVADGMTVTLADGTTITGAQEINKLFKFAVTKFITSEESDEDGIIEMSYNGENGEYENTLTLKYKFGDVLPQAPALDAVVFNPNGYKIDELLKTFKDVDGTVYTNGTHFDTKVYVPGADGKPVQQEVVTNVGTYRVTVTPIGTCVGPVQELELTINRMPVADKVTDYTWGGKTTTNGTFSVPFTGGAVTPTPTAEVDVVENSTDNPEINETTDKVTLSIVPEKDYKDAVKAGTQAGIDGYVTYANNTAVTDNGAVATITYVGNYTGEKVQNFSITPAALGDLEGFDAKAASQLKSQFNPDNDLTSADVLDPVVQYDSGEDDADGEDIMTKLELGKDYRITRVYPASSQSGVPQGVTLYKFDIEGIGNYKGTATGEFRVTTQNLEELAVAMLTDEDAPVFYTGAEREAGITVKLKLPNSDKLGVSLTENVDYAVDYKDNVNAGTATATITGTGDYAGTLEVQFEIQPLLLDGASAEDIVLEGADGLVYSGKAFEPDVLWGKSKLTPANVGYDRDGIDLKDYVDDLTYTYENNTNASTEEAPAYVVVSGKTGNFKGSVKVPFTIAQADIADATIETAAVAPGGSVADAVVAKYGDATLAADTDYTVEAKGSVPGTVAATIAGTGNFTGTVEKDVAVLYDVAKADVAVADAVYTGSAQTPKVEVSYTSGGKKVVVDPSAYDVKVDGNATNAGTYKVTVSGRTAAGWTGSVEKTFTISKAAGPKAATVTYTDAGAPVVTIPGLTEGKDFKVTPNPAQKKLVITYTGNYTGSTTVDYKPVGGADAPVTPGAAGKTGWVGSGNDWAYYKDGQQVKNGWELIGGEWYHFEKSGKMTNTKWFQDADGEWYLLNQSHKGSYGAMLAGWQKVDGGWYYMGSDGAMESGWVKDKGAWYLLNTKHDGTFGKMLTGWQQVGGKWYYMDASGAMASNEWVGRYWVNGSGVWTATR